MEKLLTIMAQLRDKESGCPWDIEQDYHSITKHTIEEAYEVVDAVEKNDMVLLKEELGDLLLQVVFYAQMAKEDKLFDFDDVVETICHKLEVRHPHIFGKAVSRTAAEQEVYWEKQKEKERADKKQAGIFDGVAEALPALMRAEKLQKRAAKQGFDWPDWVGAHDKTAEELEEVKQAAGTDDIQEEIGDLLFAAVNLARKHKQDPEEALRLANQKFISRIEQVEQALKQDQKTFQESSLKELDHYWENIKKTEKSQC